MDGIEGEHAVEASVGKGQTLSLGVENVKPGDVQKVCAKLFKHVRAAIDEMDEQLLAKPVHQFNPVASRATSHVRSGHNSQARQGTRHQVDRLRIRGSQLVVSGGDGGEVVRNRALIRTCHKCPPVVISPSRFRHTRVRQELEEGG